MSRSSETDAQAWALYPWFPEAGIELVHPEDLEAIKALSPYGKVFRVSPCDSGFVRISYGDQAVRVSPSLLTNIPAPKFDIGDAVRVRNKDGEAVVRGIEWHHRDERAFYLLTRNGKADSKRYWETDLEGLEPST